MCFGSDDSPPQTPSLPPPPPPIEIMDAIDNRSGVESIIATDPATGKKRRIINTLPRSPEDQQLYDLSNNMLRDSMSEAMKLYKTMPTEIVDFKPFVQAMNKAMQTRSGDFEKVLQLPDFSSYVNDFNSMNQEILDREFNTRGSILQENLTRRGYGQNSTASTELKMALAREQSMAKKQATVESLRYGQELYERDLARRFETYNATEANRQAQLADIQNQYNLEKNSAADKNTARQAALANLQGLYGLASNIKGADLNKQLASPAPQLALGEFQAQNQNQLAYYNADVNRLSNQYQMDSHAYNSRPPSPGQYLLGATGTIGGMALSRKFFG